MKHLAQLNISRFKIDPNDRRAAVFFNNIDRVNGIADRSEGFVWRLVDEDNDPAIPVFGDPTIIHNLTVWESGKALENFVWKTVHKKIYERKDSWFEAPKEPMLVMWWVDEGYRPTLTEAVERLVHLRENGPSEYAFGWAELPDVELFKAQQCA